MNLVQKIKERRLQIISAYCRTKPIQEKKILFWSDLGHRYSCNPRYLSEYILKQYSSKMDIVWMFDREIDIPKDFPQEIRVVRYFSKQWLYEIATAKYIICNHRIPPHFFFKKRKGQVYIQTWHSSLRLKAIEKDAEQDLTETYIHDAQADSRQIDFIISGCKDSSRIFRQAFWYDGKLLESGTPRIDYLIQQSENKEILLKKMGLDKQYHYALYAPTFRKGNGMGAYDINIERLCDNLEKRFGGQWKVLYRLHPNLAKKISLNNLPECCINMTFYQDMQELLVISDILITDYSSSMFDMAYLNKLCILYVSDLENYIATERRLYYDIEKLPFLITKNNDELEKVLKELDMEYYQKRLDDFMEKIGSFETGNACERICNILFK